MKNVNIDEAVFNEILGVRRCNNPYIEEEKQREGFQFGTIYVVGKTYTEFIDEIRKQSLTNEKLKSLYGILY